MFAFSASSKHVSRLLCSALYWYPRLFRRVCQRKSFMTVRKMISFVFNFEEAKIYFVLCQTGRLLVQIM